ncbi:MAG: hypothetical protein AAF732_08050 [Pseudomonadota bacterium]
MRSYSKLARQIAAVSALVALGCLGFSANSQVPTPETYAEAVGGQLVAPGDLIIDDTPMRCGRRPTVLDARLDDFGAAFPGFVILNPRLMARVSKTVKLWIYAHECGHQYRGPDETKADCFAVQRGRRYGWLDSDGLEQICTFIRPAKSTMMHLSGSRRCEVMRQCFKDRRVW